MSDPGVYRRHSTITDPGPFRGALAALPRDPARLRALVPGIVVHQAMGGLYGTDVAARAPQARLRTLTGMLREVFRLDPAPLTQARNPDRRLVGNCRASTVLACGLLREHGVPARARCGFSAYFHSPINGDHWVTEWWDADAGTWKLMDAELDEVLMRDNDIRFDPMDVPRDRFHLAGDAWRGSRRGELDPDGFGLDPATTGLGYIAGQLLRDLAALNSVEVGPWDTWGPAAPGATPAGSAQALLDRVAEATASPDAERALRLYESDARLRPPNEFVRDPTPSGRVAP